MLNIFFSSCIIENWRQYSNEGSLGNLNFQKLLFWVSFQLNNTAIVSVGGCSLLTKLAFSKARTLDFKLRGSNCETPENPLFPHFNVLPY